MLSIAESWREKFKKKAEPSFAYSFQWKSKGLEGKHTEQYIKPHQ
ncbi:hypothetical protein OIU78_006483 [Salix suchowensis]|nr:hypothetical protein OIU78_006483 [Salix suchowensis]